MTTSSSTPDSDVSTVAELATGISFAMLTTTDETGALVSRPMASRGIDEQGDLWFLSSRDSRKVAQIQADPRVGVALTSRDVWISVAGTAEVVEDSAKAAELWSPQMEGWFPQGPEDPSVVLVKVSGETAEYWDTPGGLVASALSFVKVKTTGKRYAGNENEVVSL